MLVSRKNWQMALMAKEVSIGAVKFHWIKCLVKRAVLNGSPRRHAVIGNYQPKSPVLYRHFRVDLRWPAMPVWMRMKISDQTDFRTTRISLRRDQRRGINFKMRRRRFRYILRPRYCGDMLIIAE